MIWMLIAALAQDAGSIPNPPPWPKPKPGEWFPQDSYPAEARAAGANGNVSVMLDVDEKGRVSGCRVTQSSGFAVLDDHTCKMATKNARFTPAKAEGRPVPSHYALRNVAWRCEMSPKGCAKVTR